MKTLTIFAIGALVFFSVAATPAAENTNTNKNQNKSFDGFSFIRTHRQGKRAVVSWSFLSSNVSGFIVQRTNEDPNDPYSVWIDVATVGCDMSRSYKCCDENPFPGLINYRVIAVMNNGNTMTSDISTVRIVAH
jgi:hypothetical protein